jgi:hypothetical protein
MKNKILISKNIENIPLYEIDLLCQYYDARLDVDNGIIVFAEIIEV